MPCGFLTLATAAGPVPAAPPAGGWGTAVAFTVALLLLLTVVLALLLRNMRRHLIDEPTRRHETASIDPWAEAGRRLGRDGGVPRPGDRPQPERESGEGDGQS